MRLTERNKEWMEILNKKRELEKTEEVQNYLKAKREVEEMYFRATAEVAKELRLDEDKVIEQQLILESICSYWRESKGELEDRMEEVYEKLRDDGTFDDARMVSNLIHEEKHYREIIKNTIEDYEKLLDYTARAEDHYGKGIKYIYIGEGQDNNGETELSAVVGVEYENGKIIMYGPNPIQTGSWEVENIEEMEREIMLNY